MAIYAYKCGECGHEFEVIQKMSDDPLKTCPKCQRDTLVKQVSSGAFCLKGYGWTKAGMNVSSRR